MEGTVEDIPHRRLSGALLQHDVSDDYLSSTINKDQFNPWSALKILIY